LSYSARSPSQQKTTPEFGVVSVFQTLVSRDSVVVVHDDIVATGGHIDRVLAVAEPDAVSVTKAAYGLVLTRRNADLDADAAALVAWVWHGDDLLHGTGMNVPSVTDADILVQINHLNGLGNGILGVGNWRSLSFGDWLQWGWLVGQSQLFASFHPQWLASNQLRAQQSQDTEKHQLLHL